MITVFFDDKCGLCSREIAYYKKVASSEFEWVPISADIGCLQRYGIDTVDALKLLHVVDHSGAVHKGVDSFFVIWRHLDRWRYLAAIASLPLVYQVLKRLYTAFAEWRFKRLPHCRTAVDS
tara:strand:- start:414 stop:776 length:363 start_codon:yes stop_codon:yes gene_type:complete